MANIVIQGEINASITTGPFLEDREVASLKVYNKSANVITVNLSIKNSNETIAIAPVNMQLSVGQGYEDDGITLKAGNSLFLTVTDVCDYYFDFQPLA